MKHFLFLLGAALIGDALYRLAFRSDQVVIVVAEQDRPEAKGENSAEVPAPAPAAV